MQILHEKVELYRLSIGLGGVARRFGDEPASILMCSHLFLRVESTHNVNFLQKSSAPPGPAGLVLVLARQAVWYKIWNHLLTFFFSEALKKFIKALWC